MKQKLQHFMADRYGMDGLGQFMSRLSLVLLVLGLFLSRVFYYAALVVLVLCYVRMFSKNREKRVQENYAYYGYRNKVTSWFSAKKQRFAERGTYRYFKCPSCGQQVRVPRGRGLIAITCPKCHTEFRKKS